MPSKKEMVKTIDGIECLSMGSSAFYADSYLLTLTPPNDNNVQVHEVYEAGSYLTFKDLQEARSKQMPSFKEQMAEGTEAGPGNIQISGIGTSVLIIGNFILKNGQRERLFICNTRKKEKGLWASAFSGYVNKRQTPDMLTDPIVFTMHNEVHEELLLWDRNDEAIRVNFYPWWIDGDLETWPIFGHRFDEFKNSLRAYLFPERKLSWLNTMPVRVRSCLEFENNKFDCFFDSRFNNLQVVTAYEINIDLREITLTSSETVFKNGKLYEEFFDGQREESHLILLPLDNPYGDLAYKPDVNSESGLIKVSPPEVLSEIFNVRREKLSWPTDTTKYLEIAITDGDWVRTEHAWKPFKI